MLAARVLKDFFVQKVESIIDDDKTVKHSKLGEQVEQVIQDPGKVSSCACDALKCLFLLAP